jgi:glyoxylase-like metal-dependent hydrolase (beta-lactamase superfamily II)
MTTLPHGTVREIADRIWVIRYRFFDQGIGVVAGDDGLAVVDTRSTHVQAHELLDDIRALSPLPIAVVVNTHHHYDHSWGNHVLRPAAIWGHVRCAERMRGVTTADVEALAAELPRIADDLRAVEIDPPEQTFHEAATLEVGGRRLELAHLGRGHTDDDIVVTIPDAGVLFAGDLLENGAPPYFGDGYPLDWPETVSRLLDLVRGPVVPGHGDVGDRAFVEDQLAALVAVAETARRVRRGELELDAAVATGPFGPEASREPLERALAQLRGELD